MPQFLYKGLDATGETASGSIDAADETEAYALLESRSLSIFELSEARASTIPWYAHDIRLFSSDKHSLADQATIAELLGTLASLELPATQMIQIAADNAPTSAIRKHLTRMNSKVEDGTHLALAFSDSGSGFSEIFHQIFSVAVRTNTLPSAMANLSQMLRRADKLRGRVNSALIYPTILIAAAFFLVGFITLYLTPALAPMFVALEKPMPFLLGVLHDTGQALASHSDLIRPAILIVVMFIFLFLLPPQTAETRAALLQRLPLIGPIRRESYLLSHMSALEVLLRGGLDLPTALDIASKVGSHSRYAPSFSAGAEGLRQGNRAVDAMREEGSLPSLVLALIAVGEETNTLGQASETLTEILETRLKRRTDRAMQLLTPLLTLSIGSIIGLLVYSVMGAILDVNTSAF
jgi:general secretion pathway protein F